MKEPRRRNSEWGWEALFLPGVMLDEETFQAALDNDIRYPRLQRRVQDLRFSCRLTASLSSKQGR